MSSSTLTRPVFAALVLALLLGLAAGTSRTASAQQPVVVGDVPAEGVAILQTGAAATPAELTASLADLGCAAVGIAIAEGGAWLIHIPGAPAFVNAAFPASLPAGQLFLVRCQPSLAGQQFNLLEASGTGNSSFVATLTDARAGGHAGFDRFVVEFEDGALPGYEIEYVTTPQFTCGAGFEVTPAGNAALQIKLETARINDDNGQLTIPSRSLAPNFPALLEAQEICGFEGQVIWLLGLDSEQPFQLQILTNPSRLVIDVPHSTPATASGVSGLALAGPQCPVQIAGQPCPDLPVDVMLAFGQGGTTVATVQTGADGGFALDLAAGTYGVTVVGGILPSLGPTEVVVPAGRHAWVELHLDTGIR